MKLYIAEKPSVGRAIVDVLPRPHRSGNGHMIAADGSIVTWCIGHLLEQAEPDAYDPAFKKWSMNHLPIVPADWKLKPKSKTRAQLNIVKKLIREAKQIVHAGDPDREGQLLVDEVLLYAGNASKKNQALRCLINDLNPEAVRQSLNNLQNNADYQPLSTSALARSRADWLYGINLTRAYTLQGRQRGHKGVMSVGRVQTPVLGLVVRRDREIAEFVAKPYYEVWANLQTDKQEHFKAKWLPSEACRDFLDARQRNLSRPLAENVAARISNQPAVVENLERTRKKLPPPLPYNLSALQMDANRRYGLSASETLDACQSLYEKHKLITYPRSDCRYLPEAHRQEIKTILATIEANHTTLNIDDYQRVATHLSPARKSRTWNDKKVGAHHAIIPTRAAVRQLSPTEKKVYQLVSRQYLAQFLADHTYFDTTVTVAIQSGKFIAREKEADQSGWKLLYQTVDSPDSAKKQTSKTTKINTAVEAEDNVTLPTLVVGQALQSLEAEISEKKTTPPAHFTDATLLGAMTGISHYVKDTELRKILRETDGLGTEATRAGIIELLFRREFLCRIGKTIQSTAAGQSLINALPESTTLPDRTARWESLLQAISQGDASYEQLMEPLVKELQTLIPDSRFATTTP